MAAAHVKQLRYEKNQRDAAVAVQSRWRAHAAQVVFISTLDKYQQANLRDAATVISSSWRGFVCRSEYEQTLVGA
jgi:hypothetical protein